MIREIVRRRVTGVEGNSSVNGAAPKLALVIEGGGMRGIYSGGMLVAMESLGLTNVFDGVFGESAGAINAAYFLSGQGAFGIRIYLEDLASLKFANPLRIGRMLDVDYAVDTVVKSVKPLNVDRVLRNPSRFHVAVTNGATGEPRVIAAQRGGVPLLTLLKASAAIVPLYNRAVEIDGHPYVDGGIANPIPVGSAIFAGYTHILVLLTQPLNFFATPFTALQRACIAPLFLRWPPAFVAAFYDRLWRHYNETRDLALGRTAAGDGVSIAVIAPAADSPRFSRSTRARSKLLAAKDDAVQRTLRVFAELSRVAERPQTDDTCWQARTGT